MAPDPQPCANGVPNWAQARTLFQTLSVLPVSRHEQKRAELDDNLAAEVRSLLAQDVGFATDSHGFMAQGAATALALPEAGREVQLLGAWRIGEKLGSGGMGDVWLAQRDNGAYAGQATLKVLKRGMDSTAVLARFTLEQQALARLSHAHIAHLLDAGRTADGLPYFVMEHVKGQPLRHRQSH
jgi:eukaryotic-like serine/threonine-protein kinase